MRSLVAIAFSLLCSTAFAGNLCGIDHYIFTVSPREALRYEQGLIYKTDLLQGHYWGGCYNLPVSRNSALSIGAGITSIRYQKEIQGVFPETGTYGFIYEDGTMRYWSFPVSLFLLQSKHNFRGYNPTRIFSTGLRFSYVPSFINNGINTLQATGGAALSPLFLSHRNTCVNFQQSLLLSITNQVFISRCKLCIDPYIGFGSGWDTSDHLLLSNINYGLRLSLQFPFPHISFEVYKDPANDAKKKELLKKQKEIEEQLKKNKPK